MSEKKKFNIFKVAGITQAEEIHTSIIAELINPHSKFHDHGQDFLDAFIERIGTKEEEKIFNMEDFKGAHVKPEVQTYEGRRIDMVISSERYYVAIEVKIGADDQEAQLWDYHEFAKCRMKRDEDIPPIFYLTPSGKQPTDRGRGVGMVNEREGLGLDKIKCISFMDDILPWLEECIKKPEISDDVLQIMEQLRENIRDNLDFDKNEYGGTVRNDDLLNILRKKISDRYDDRSNSRWTENKNQYLTFRLNKNADLEFALRIEWDNNKRISLKIICGYGLNDSPNYSNANSFIKMHYGKFIELLEDTFIHTIYINPSQSAWARYEEHLIWQDDMTIDEFVDECFLAVAEILSNCREFAS